MLTQKNRSRYSGFLTRRHIWGTLILYGMTGNAYAGSCTGTLGIYTCSGIEDSATDTEQVLNGNSLSVITLPGFGIVTNSGRAFSLLSTDDLTFTDDNNATITGNDDGIYAANTSSGAVSITTTGTVTGNNGYGILGSTIGTNLTINAANVSGNIVGVYAENFGTGSVSVTTTGSVTAKSDSNIGIYVDGRGTDVTIQAVDVSGQLYGISALNFGIGATSIIATGIVTANEGVGIFSSTIGTGLTINAVNVLGDVNGIFSENAGTGAQSITATGTVTGALSDGIYAYNGNGGTSQTIQAADVSGYTSGIYAENQGSGALSITTTGTVTNTDTTGYGIAARSTIAPMSLTLLENSTVQGHTAGIYADSTASVDITNFGTVRNVSRRASDLAILTTGASGVITNNGLVLGTLQLSGEGNSFINNSGGTWDTAGGTNDFGTPTTANGVVNNGTIIAANGPVADSVQNTIFNNVGTFSNAGILTMANGRAGDITIINGNYEGSGGQLLFDTVLGGDDSASDKLVVNGNTAGSTYVSVNNAGGREAQTLNGIELIQVNGQSDGEFVQNGRIVAGAYDYFLVRGVGTNATNWYLSSAAVPVDPVDPVDPAVPVAPDPSLMVERPEAGVYSANLAAANNMFVTRLHDRLGETQYTDVLTGEKKVTSMWLRNEGGHNRSRDDSGQLKTQANRYVMQLGGGIAQWSHDGLDRLHLGLMAGYGNSKSNTASHVSGYDAKGSVDGYSVGVYGTWYANAKDKSGLYADGWMQYSWFNNSVDGQGLAKEEYKSKGTTASVESGYTFKLGENAEQNVSYFIQPKAQLTWMGVKADDHKETNGTDITGEGNNNIQTHLGIKAFMNGYADQDKGKNRVFQPFVEVNWVHNSKDFGTKIDGIIVKQDGAANIAELKMGVEGKLSKQVSLWGNVGQQVGNKGYSDTSAILGIKYDF
ncbi:autotransporter outer membrane beta-barrel domain-containing protein [Serratia sp. UGAL515B_01]|uniref:autotransporter outer membrane beta-barrel domain-containing protein n=1 Tax=Serratia sp. UGAL515B_01 TaxID=2986763 RepID=UPI002954B3A3|nr:autotransporter outer membrane beta-barrel domain-containing protein [Serratia sp. UGAL515B_01]WON78495.1 autotransporter outer membrane beta-barrel domain-containing protein [Serratia sp. UGAL515B_01]